MVCEWTVRAIQNQLTLHVATFLLWVTREAFSHGEWKDVRTW